MNPKPDQITIFTDGSSRGNPGPGGFGAIIIAPNTTESGTQTFEVTELGGREKHTTNNRMELQAAISALHSLSNVKGQLSIVLHCDSSYVVNGITKWIHGWKKNNWMTSQRKPVENRDLWEALEKLAAGKSTEWKNVGGHIGVAGNERCDEIATAFADGNSPRIYKGPLEKYPIKNILAIEADGRKKNMKEIARARSRARAYSYVSLVGGIIQTHQTWAECERRVKGVPGAKYKKVASAEAEVSLVAEWSKK